MKTIKRTAVIVGCSVRWDVATKSRVVEAILSQTYQNQEALNTEINLMAKEFKVSPPTIKAWLNKFQFMYTKTKKCSPGTLQISPGVIAKKSDAEKLRKKTNNYKKELAKFLTTIETAPNSTESATNTRNATKPSYNLIDDLQK